MSKTLLTGLMAGTALLCTPATFAQTMTPEIDVTATSLFLTPGYHFFLPQSADGADSADAGTYLTSIAGISTSRMGGHGTDPVIRGQQQTQLNIINDGAMIHGGCPSRMDPPTSFASPRTFDSVTVLKGYQTVRYGAGGTGGTVLFERNPVPFTADEIATQGAAGGNYETNGQIRSAYADAAAGNKYAQIRALWSGSKGDNYTDGGGNKVRSGFSANSYSLIPVWTPTEDTTIKASTERSETKDVLYAGMMDSPEGSSLTHRLSLDHHVQDNLLKSLSLKTYINTVDHTMDNYTLRDSTGMKMRTPSESDTLGGSLSGDLMIADMPVTLGIDLQNNERDAWSYTGTALESSADTISARIWPDVLIRQTGFYAEANPKLSEKSRLRFGGRFDWVQAKARDADTVYGTSSANALYLAHYGKTADDVNEHNVGGLLRLEHDLAQGLTLFTGLSRSVRTADATERYLASNSSMASMRRVGNPDLAPEKHHQFDIGASHVMGNSNTTMSGYVDYVQDYIMKDLARGQDGILVSNGATIYRNINARLMGLEIENEYRILPDWTLVSSLSYTYGNNDDDNDALAQIPPLEGRIALEYAKDIWSFGTRFHFATRQNRIDDQTSERDIGQTGGYGTIDIYGKVNVHPFEIRLGATNLLDKQYANHLNKSNTFDPLEVQVNEPGRSFGLQINARF